jgi:hypothetical protein
MATLAQSVPESPRPLVWLWEFLQEELAPYPGRTALVVRMVIAATLVMLITGAPVGAWSSTPQLLDNLTLSFVFIDILALFRRNPHSRSGRAARRLPGCGPTDEVAAWSPLPDSSTL